MQKEIQISNFILPAFESNTKFTIIRAGRQTGKTYNAFCCILIELLSQKKTCIWVDTIQPNLDKYVDRYVRDEIMGVDFFNKVCNYDKQKHILTFENGSFIDFVSAEKPENIEGFSYDYVILNEAGIILKKKGLWENSIEPMTKTAKVFIIGTPKGKMTKYEELSNKCKTDKDWSEFHYTCFDSEHWQKKELNRREYSTIPHVWKQEYLAEFVSSTENALIKEEYLRYYEDIDLDDFDDLYVHADTTHTAKTTSDYFCVGVMGRNKKNKNYYLIDFVLDKIDVESQARVLINIYSKYRTKIKKITYDEKANQGFETWVKKLSKEEYDLSLPLLPLKYSKDKSTHFEPHFPHFIANRIYLPSNHSQIAILTQQILSFPDNSVHDDAIDMLSGCLDNYINNQTVINLGAEWSEIFKKDKEE